MKLKKLITLMAASLAFTSGAALAEPFYIDIDQWDTVPTAASVFGTNGTTALMSQMQINWSATSVYTDLDSSGGVTVGDSVVDSGIGTVGGFLSGAVNLSGLEAHEGLSSFYDMNFDYTNLSGTVLFASGADILALYTSGTINLYGDYTAGSGVNQDVLLLTLDVFNSTGTIGNILIFGEVTYALPNVWFFPPATDWSGSVIAINARIDTNLDNGGVPTSIGNNQFSRTSELNGSVEFNRVPEPASIALLGLGLLGLGFSRRNKKSA